MRYARSTIARILLHAFARRLTRPPLKLFRPLNFGRKGVHINRSARHAKMSIPDSKNINISICSPVCTRTVQFTCPGGKLRENAHSELL